MTITDLQSRITSICAEVLKRSDLGPDDDLLQLGMDSLTAVEIVTRLELAYGVDVVDVIFETPTVASSARWCAGPPGPPEPPGPLPARSHRPAAGAQPGASCRRPATCSTW